MINEIIALMVTILGIGIGGFFAFRKWKKAQKKIMQELEEAKETDPLINIPPEYLKNKNKKEVVVDVKQEKEIEILRRAIRGDPEIAERGELGSRETSWEDNLGEGLFRQVGLGREDTGTGKIERGSPESLISNPDEAGADGRGNIQDEHDRPHEQNSKRTGEVAPKFKFRRRRT